LPLDCSAKSLFASAQVRKPQLDSETLKKEMLDMKSMNEIRPVGNDGSFVSMATSEAKTLKKLALLHSQALNVKHAKTHAQLATASAA